MDSRVGTRIPVIQTKFHPIHILQLNDRYLRIPSVFVKPMKTKNVFFVLDLLLCTIAITFFFLEKTLHLINLLNSLTYNNQLLSSFSALVYEFHYQLTVDYNSR